MNKFIAEARLKMGQIIKNTADLRNTLPSRLQAAYHSLPARIKHTSIRLSIKNQILFIKQLAILIRSEIPLLSALTMLKRQTKSKSMHAIVDQTIKDVENGHYLSTTLGKFKNIFGDLTINIIAIGEVSGTLSDNLEYLAVSLKKKQLLQSKIISASIYPIFIIIATLIITIMLVVFVFPKIIPVFKSIHYQLPWSTRFLIFLNAKIHDHWLLIIMAFIAISISVWLLLKNKRLHYKYDQVLLFTPLINQFIVSYNMAHLCRTLGLLLKSGTGAVRSFQITSHTITHRVYKKELEDVANELTKGVAMSVQMEKNPRVFPVMASQMVAVGEKTGKLSDTFFYLADIYEEELDGLAKNLATTIEPLLLMFMGILVGFIAISIITPIYGITQHLAPK